MGLQTRTIDELADTAIRRTADYDEARHVLKEAIKLVDFAEIVVILPSHPDTFEDDEIRRERMKRLWVKQTATLDGGGEPIGESR